MAKSARRWVDFIIILVMELLRTSVNTFRRVAARRCERISPQIQPCEKCSAQLLQLFRYVAAETASIVLSTDSIVVVVMVLSVLLR